MKRLGRDGETNITVNKNKVWRNEEVRFIEKIKCYIPTAIIDIMNGLDKMFSGDEFSIFAKSNWDKENKILRISEEYFVPLQEVSAAAVDYLEQPPDGFNVVMHKHPGSNSKTFSGIDDDYINQNFDVSLLWSGSKFTHGHVRTKTEFGNILINLDLVIPEPIYEIPATVAEKIRKKTYAVTTTNAREWTSGNCWDIGGEEFDIRKFLEM